MPSRAIRARLPIGAVDVRMHARAGGPVARSFRVGATIAAALLVTALAAPAPALAVDYPTWADVQAARASEAASRAAVANIDSLLAGLARDSAAATARADALAAAYLEAQQRLDDAVRRSDRIAAQTAEAEARAAKSSQGARVAMVAMSKSRPFLGEAMLFAPRSDADGYLYRVQAATELAESFDDRLTAATQDARAAAALRDQASVARAEVDRREKDTRAALAAARAESDRLQAQIDQSTVQRAQLQAQRDVLVQKRAATEADYQRGVQVREAAARAAAAAAAAAARGATNGQGWALPISGPITSRFGARPERPVPGVKPFHSAVDIAAGCGRTIYAATSGRVSYSGWLGTYGLWIQIDHGGGVQTGYAHNSRLLVPEGASVSAGQPIALVGTTGASNGCHSHLEVAVGGGRVDPVPFFGARGIRLG